MKPGGASVPLKEYFEALRAADDRRHTEQLAAVDRRHTELAAERNRAIEAGLAAANEKAASHNNVLSAMKDAQAAFVTKNTIFWAVTSLISGAGIAYAIIRGSGH